MNDSNINTNPKVAHTMSEENPPFVAIASDAGVTADQAEATIGHFLQWADQQMASATSGGNHFIETQLPRLIGGRTYSQLIRLLLGMMPDFGSTEVRTVQSTPEGAQEETASPALLEMKNSSPHAPELLEQSMRYVMNLDKGFDYTIDINFCDLNSSFYVYIVAEQNFFNDDLSFTARDYVPVSLGELLKLKWMPKTATLREIEALSKGRECLLTSRGSTVVSSSVYYPFN